MESYILAGAIGVHARTVRPNTAADFYRTQAVTHNVKVVISRKLCKTETLIGSDTWPIK